MACRESDILYNSDFSRPTVFNFLIVLLDTAVNLLQRREGYATLNEERLQCLIVFNTKGATNELPYSRNRQLRTAIDIKKKKGKERQIARECK